MKYSIFSGRFCIFVVYGANKLLKHTFIMKRFFLLVAMTFIAVAATAQDHDWAQFGRYAEANKSITSRPDAVFLGNSITDMWASGDPEFFSRNNFVGRGIGGQTTSEMLVRFRQDVIDLNPRVVLIMAGTNDIARNNGYISLENMLSNVKSMCELAKLHKIKVVICSVTPCAYYPWRRHIDCAPIIPQFNAMLKEYAEQNGFYYLDYYSALVDERGGIPQKWTTDECHLTLLAYREIMEPMACEAINKVLKTRKSERFIAPLPEN